VKVIFTVPRAVLGFLCPVIEVTLAAQIGLAAVDSCWSGLRGALRPTGKNSTGCWDERLLVLSGVVGNGGILASVGVLVEGIMDGSVCVQVGALLEAFVFTFPIIFFCLDVRMSCQMQNVRKKETGVSRFRRTGKMLEICRQRSVIHSAFI
jgi:hypothetical protein